MYRVVTKTLRYQNGQWRRQVESGPWQPHHQWATTWAEYLKSTHHYDVVEIQSNVPGQSAQEAIRD
jgi:hypothetical protein